MTLEQTLWTIYIVIAVLSAVRAALKAPIHVALLVGALWLPLNLLALSVFLWGEEV